MLLCMHVYTSTKNTPDCNLPVTSSESALPHLNTTLGKSLSFSESVFLSLNSEKTEQKF